jgi:hypothetical protein
MTTNLKALEYPNAAAVRARLRVVLGGLCRECLTTLSALAAKETDQDVLVQLDYLWADAEEVAELIDELERHSGVRAANMT